jgi:3-oxoacyl-[acyl-carrier-protein] synthase-3
MAFIKAIESFIPSTTIDTNQVLNNYKEFAAVINSDITSDSINAQNGINFRKECPPDLTPKDMGIAAAQSLLEQNPLLEVALLDAVIYVSNSLEYAAPATACIIQNELQLPQSIMAFDIVQGCSGWITGLKVCKGLLCDNATKNILLITADAPRRVLHPADVEMTSIFSDAATASWISSDSDCDLPFEIGDFIFGTDGKGAKSLYVEKSAVKNPPTIAYLEEHRQIPSGLRIGRMRMDSKKVFLFAVDKVPKLTKALLKEHNITIDDVDFFIFHQANGKMLEFLRNRIKIPKEKFLTNISDMGNTVASSIPIILSERINEHKMPKNSTILIAGFGIGFSWGGTILKT